MSEEKSPYITKEQVHNRAKDAVGKTMRELYNSAGIYDVDDLVKNKSFIGDAFECWMKVPKNSRAEADIVEAGVELKATPYKVLKSGKKSAKERLVLNIIDYVEEAKQTFETSSFQHKDKLMELAFYENDGTSDKSNKANWTIDESILFSFPEKDLKIIKHDWEVIHQYIIDGKAHEINEGLTDYLAACTKGKSKKSVREQPYSDIPAKQRAYSLKAGYMTSILRDYVFGDKKDPAIRKAKFTEKEENGAFPEVESIFNENELQNGNLDKALVDKLNKYKGMKLGDLPYKGQKLSNVIPKNKRIKQKFHMAVSGMLGLVGDAETAEEIQKADIIIKAVRVNKNSDGDFYIKENMSFPAFDFKDIAIENWEDSNLYRIVNSKFLFAIFEENEDTQREGFNYTFRGVKIWNMPNDDISTVKKVWEDTKSKIANGVELRFKSNRVLNNFVNESDNMIVHVRPHSKEASYINNAYSNELPTPAKWISEKPQNRKIDDSNLYMTKQCFWLNKDYVFGKILKGDEYETKL